MSLSTRHAKKDNTDVLYILQGRPTEYNEVNDGICTAAVKILVKNAG